jgi:hypothetical protein
MREELLWGAAILGDPPEWSDAEARAAWQLHRAELMAEVAKDWPGERPWGYWRFDLHQEKPTDWWREFELLDGLGLIDADERLRFGNLRCPALSSVAELNAGVVVEGAKAHDAYMLRRTIGESAFRAAWFEKSHPEQARFHQEVADGLKTVAPRPQKELSPDLPSGDITRILNER